MANLANIKDNKGGLDDRIVVDRHGTYTVVGESRTIHGLSFDFSPLRARISWVHEEDGVEEGYYHSFFSF